ncbi:hypothetical protein ADEAN_000323000 [Angomonas deanei]|uniref:Uncharacterized protein n=1 Tax=Angomonas deanei TaxID=59799 RepID=A0A7G2CCG6_9TRYP|nr:hypothetical protein ADEAN_000323000 [Angomonas deanei]
MTNTISVTQNLLELLSLKEDYYKDMAEGQRKLLSEGAARQVVADTFLVETVLKEQNYTRYKVSQEEGMLKKVQGSMEELERNYVLNLERLMELCNTHLSNHHKDTDKQKLTLPEIREDILEEFKTGNDKLMALKSSILREAQTAFIELWQKTSESNLETCSLNQGNLSQCLCCGLSPQYTTTLQDECGTEDYQRIIHHLALLDPTQNIPFILSELDHIERHHLHAADTAHHGRREVTDTKPQEGPNMLESDTRKPFFDKERPPPQSVQRLMQEETARRADGMQQNSTNGPYNPTVNNNNSVFFSSSLFANNSKVSVDLNNNKVFVPNPPRYFSAPQTRSANNNNSNSSNSEATPASSSTRGGRRQYTLLSQMAEEEKKYKETNRNRLLNKMMLNTVVVGEDDDDVYNTYYPVHAAGEELPKNDTAFRKTGSVAPPVPPRRLYINSVMEQNSHSAEEVLASNGRNAVVATFPPLRASSMQQD